MLKVELKKGFVGITADGEKIEFPHHPHQSSISSGGSWINGKLDEEASAYWMYRLDGSRDPGWAGPKPIVAPYPSERPFDNRVSVGSKYYVLKLKNGNIFEMQTTKVVNGDYLSLKYVDRDSYIIFGWDGLQRNCSPIYFRVLGPVEEKKSAPIVDDEGTYVFQHDDGKELEEFIGRITKAETRRERPWDGWVHIDGGSTVQCLVVGNDGTTNVPAWEVVRKAHRPEPAPKLKGMTLKRWKEIKTYSESVRRMPNAALAEVISWIGDKPINGSALVFDPEPVEYEPHDIVSMAEELKRGRYATLGGLQRNEFNIESLRLDGVIILRRATGATSKLTYHDLQKHHVWMDDNSPVARKKNDGNNEST